MESYEYPIGYFIYEKHPKEKERKTPVGPTKSYFIRVNSLPMMKRQVEPKHEMNHPRVAEDFPHCM